MAFNRNINAHVGHQHLADFVQAGNRLGAQLVFVSIKVDVLGGEHIGLRRVNIVDVEIFRDGRRIIRRHWHGKFLRLNVFAILAHRHLVSPARKHRYLVSTIWLGDVAEAQGRFVGLGTTEHQLYPGNNRRTVTLREHLALNGGVLDVIDGIDVLLTVATDAVAAQISV